MDLAVKMMFLHQGTRSIEDYVVDFLELAHLTHLDEICLIIFFRGGLSEPLSSIMPLHDPNWTLENYIDIALQLSGSPFTVGIAEEENNSPVITSTPEPCHKIAAASEFRPIMTAVPEPSTPEPAPSQELAESAPEPAPSQELAESAPEPAPSQELAESAPQPVPPSSPSSPLVLSSLALSERPRRMPPDVRASRVPP